MAGFYAMTLQQKGSKGDSENCMAYQTIFKMESVILNSFKE